MTLGAQQPINADLGGRIALVSGAGGLIGRAICLVLARAGAHVLATDVADAALTETVRQIQAAGGTAHGVVADMASPADIDRLFAETQRLLGPLRILVDCAADVDTLGFPTTDFDDARVDRILGVNLRAPLLCAIRAARVMADHGGGAIVNLTSVGGSQRAHHTNLVYDVTKGGLDAMTRALATDLGPLGIRVNAVGPAAVTPAPPEGRGADLPLRRGGTAEDQAWAVLYLASDAARFVTGQILYVDGGLMAQLRWPEGRQAQPVATRVLTARVG